MKFPFHVTLLTLLLSLLFLTGAAIGYASYRNTRNAVQDLSQQILGHAEKRIDVQVNQVLFGALEQAELNGELLARPDVDLDSARLQRFANYWVKELKLHARFTAMGFTLDATGEGWYVRRVGADGTILVIERLRRGADGPVESRRFRSENYPNGPALPPEGLPPVADPRERPWYKQARAAGKQVWLETFTPSNRRDQADTLWFGCAVPVSRGGRLIGVFDVMFDQGQMCDFLGDISKGEAWTPFIIEVKADQTRHLIAHPDKDVLRDAITRQLQADAVADPRVNSFVRDLCRQQPNLDPTALRTEKTDEELRQLADVRFRHDGEEYLGTYRCLSTDQTPDWLICLVLPESSILKHAQEGNRRTFLILLVVALLAVAVSLLVALQVARPLRRLARETEAIGQFHLGSDPLPRSIVKEVDRLTDAVERMKLSLRSFRKYVPADVVRALFAAGKDASLGGEHRTITIYFSDIADFTSISEHLTPEQLVTQLGEYFNVQSNEILQARGTVDKYIGDAIMAFWGAPVADPGQALAACTAALRNQQQLTRLCDKWLAEKKPLFTTRIGIHTGEVIVGNIGSEARLNYTVIGDAVNLASRLEGLNKYYGTRILISESTWLQAREGVVARPLDWVSVKGKCAAVLVYELMGLKGEVDESVEKVVATYGLALTSYRAQEWNCAAQLFEQVLQIRPEDRPAREMLKRCREYSAQPPGSGWDGVQHMSAK
jgi:adenylate cyclase